MADPSVSKTYTFEDLKLNAYKVWIGRPHRSSGQDVTNICTSIQWDYDLDQACEKFTLTFVKVIDLARIIRPLDQLYIFGIKTDAVFGISAQVEALKFGIVIDVSTRSNARGEMTITAYDIMYYLNTNKSSHRLQNETATSFFKRLSGYYGFPLGHVEETGVLIGPEPFFEKTIYDMVVTSLARTRDIAFQQRIASDYPNTEPTTVPVSKRGPRFYIRTQYNKIGLLRKQDPSHIWMFEGQNIIASDIKWSAANYRNLVKVFRRLNYNIGSGSQAAAQEETDTGDISPIGQWPPEDKIPDDDIKSYGMLSETVTLTGIVDENENISDPQSQANLQAKEAYVRLHKITQMGNITSVNINTLGPGDPIYIQERITGLVGKYYIKSGQHKVTAKETTMTLTVNLEDVLPEVYKSQPEKVSTLMNSTWDFGPEDAPNGTVPNE